MCLVADVIIISFVYFVSAGGLKSQDQCEDQACQALTLFIIFPLQIVLPRTGLFLCKGELSTEAGASFL